MKANLHIHSYYSDGNLSPAGIVQLAQKSQVEVIAITDHDNISWLQELENIKKVWKKGYKLLVGVEIASKYKKKDIHLVVFGEVEDLKKLDETFLKRVREERKERIREVIKKLQENNIPISESYIFTSEEKAYTRVNIARILRSLLGEKSIRNIINEYLENGRIGYVKGKEYAYEEVIKVLNQFSFVKILAHPDFVKDTGIEFLEEVVEIGKIDGIEVVHPWLDKRLSKETYEELLKWVEKRGLIRSGGTDFHGTDSERNTLDSHTIEWTKDLEAVLEKSIILE